MTDDRHTSSDRTEEFVRLFASCQPRIYAYIRALIPDRCDAEEVFQQTSVALWQHFKEFETGTNFARWAFRVAHFRVLEFRKRQQRDRLRFGDAFVSELASHALATVPQASPEDEALHRCLARLRTRDRELIEFRYQHGSTLKSTSQHVGRSVEAIKKSLRRIRQTLLRCIKRTLQSEERA